MLFLNMIWNVRIKIWSRENWTSQFWFTWNDLVWDLHWFEGLEHLIPGYSVKIASFALHLCQMWQQIVRRDVSTDNQMNLSTPTHLRPKQITAWHRWNQQLSNVYRRTTWNRCLARFPLRFGLIFGFCFVICFFFFVFF